MTQGQLRQQSPAPDQVFDYRVETQGETVRVNLGGKEIELAVTAQGDREGWCRTADGPKRPVCSTTCCARLPDSLQKMPAGVA